jgi:hypothetical protein
MATENKDLWEQLRTCFLILYMFELFQCFILYFSRHLQLEDTEKI